MDFKIFICLVFTFGYIDSDVITSSAMKTDNNDSASSINVPIGFDSQPVPANPMLYPFAPESLYPTQTESSDWRPMLRPNEMVNEMKYTTNDPLPQERSPNSVARQSTEEGPVLQSTAYGTWKSDAPLPPHTTINQSDSSSAESGERETDSLQAMLTNEYGELIKQILNSRKVGSSPTPSSNQNHGRRRIPYRKHGPVKRIGSVAEILRVNVSDPELLNVAQQINNSAETKGAQSIWMPMLHTPSLNVSQEYRNSTGDIENIPNASKNWPSDFLSAEIQGNASTQIPLRQTSNSSTEVDDNEMNSVLSGTNVPFDLIPFNVTKMGTPFEDVNSSHEPAICVPMTIREKSTEATEYVDVGKIYCFPVPLSNEEDYKDGESDVVNADVKNVYDDGKINSSNACCKSGNVSERAISISILLIIINSYFIV